MSLDIEPVVPQDVRDRLQAAILAAAEIECEGYGLDLIARVNLLGELVEDYLDWLEETLAEPDPVH
jgi:hypothetical protein